MLSRIVHMSPKRSAAAPPSNVSSTVVAAWFVPAVMASAAIAFAAWMIWAPAPALGLAVVAAVSVLIIACPARSGSQPRCPSWSAWAKGASAGVLIKNAEALERFEKVDTLVVDKTGTLTEGKPRVTAVVAAAGLTKPPSFRWARVWKNPANIRSPPPFGSGSGTQNNPARSHEFRFRHGQGRDRDQRGSKCRRRQRRAAQGPRVASTELEARADTLRKDGATALFVAVDEKPAGIIAVADPIKATTMAALAALRSEGIRIVMLTGDNRTTAQAVAAKLGITEVEADVLPDQKNAIVRRLKSEGRVVAMAGMV